jgi:ubiquinone biosynthesis protein UbiJ
MVEPGPRPAPKPKKQKVSADKTAEKTAPSAPMDPVYEQLFNRYQSKVNEYKVAEQWVHRRLSIFEQLQKDLNMASGNQAATERIANRVSIENEKLRADKEYKWKMAELDQLRSDLETLKARLESHA